MLEGYEIIYGISTVIYFFYVVALVVASIIFYLKYKHLGTVLMLLGAILSFITYILERLSSLLFDMFDTTTFVSYQGLLYSIGNFGSLTFVVGLLMVIYHTNFSKKDRFQ